jgi:phosphoribosylformylglycinamidine synthase
MGLLTWNAHWHERNVWEETSFQLDKRQANPKCVEEERTGLASRQVPPIFAPPPTPPIPLSSPRLV